MARYGQKISDTERMSGDSRGSASIFLSKLLSRLRRKILFQENFSRRFKIKQKIPGIKSVLFL